MTSSELLMAYDWFNEKVKSIEDDKKYINSQGVASSEYYEKMLIVNKVARDIITAYAKSKGLIDNPEGWSFGAVMLPMTVTSPYEKCRVQSKFKEEKLW